MEKLKTDKCARPTCGKTRSWHLGTGGMGICRPEFKDGTSGMTKSDESTGGFLEVAHEIRFLMPVRVFFEKTDQEAWNSTKKRLQELADLLES